MTTDHRDLLAACDHHLTEIRKDLTPALNSMAGQATTGFPTSTRPGPGVSSHGHGDPVLGIVAHAKPGRRVTEHHPDRHEFDQCVVTAERLLATAHGIAHRHTPAKESMPDEGDPGCISCARVGEHKDQGKGMGGLCRWCYDHRSWHPVPHKGPEMPARSIAAAYHERGHVTTGDARKAGIAV